MKYFPKTTSYHHNNLKEALIQEAMHLLDKKPYEEITIRELTNLLNVSRTAVYRHYSSKEQLFQAVILKGFEQLKEQMSGVYDDKALHIEEKIAKTGEAYVAFALESPARYRLMFGDKLMKLREDSCEMDSSEVECSFGIVVSLIQEAQNKKLFAQADPLEQATALWALIHGQASLLIDGHPMIQEQKEKLLEMGMMMIMKGFA